MERTSPIERIVQPGICVVPDDERRRLGSRDVFARGAAKGWIRCVIPVIGLVSILISQAAGTGLAKNDDAALPPDASEALEALNDSPRHGEWMDVQHPQLASPIRTWVVYPERGDKAPVVVLIHGIYGNSDWVRAAADRLAAAGFIALAPDLLSGKGPGGAGYDGFESRDDVVKHMRELTPEEVTKQIDAVRAHALTLPAGSGKSATVGFCWGGGKSFAYATSQPGLDAAVVFYGTSPDAVSLSSVHAPVLGLYGADDERVNATVPDAQAEMSRLGKIYEVEIYKGAGHAFLSRQGERNGANRRATEQGWPRAISFLEKHLGE